MLLSMQETKIHNHPVTAMNEKPTVLIADSICYCYPRQSAPALQKVGLKLRRGEATGLLGPNGCGKSTLIDILTGLKKPQGGSLQRVGHPSPTLALVPQDYAFYPQLTCHENLMFFGRMLNLPKQDTDNRIKQAIQDCLLEPFLDKRAEQCSGGIRRKLNLAIALLQKPDILLLDEPTVGVDPPSRTVLLSLIKKLLANGCAVLYATHYMEEVSAVCDSIVLMNQGSVLASGNLSTLLTAPDGQDPFPDLEALFIHYTDRSLRD